MANANLDQDCLIITGVKKKPDNTFVVLPILNDDFVDSAIYQRLIADNIEPDLQVDYVPHLFKESQLVGIFKIKPTNDKPYMMKKDFGSGDKVRKRGESFIRKGTFTLPLMRNDIDHIFGQRLNAFDFDQKISVYFSGTINKTTVEVKPICDLVLPSQKQAKIIQEILEKRKQLKLKQEGDRQKNLSEKNNFKVPVLIGLEKIFGDIDNPYVNATASLTGGTTYEQRSTTTLQENLKNIAEIYRDQDLVEIFENRSKKINFVVFNGGTKYLEDVLIKVDINEIDGLAIADRSHVMQVSHNPFYPIREWNKLVFTLRKKQGGTYSYSERIGDLPHLQPKAVFDVPLHMAVFSKLTGKKINITLTIYGKNLQKPFKYNLVITVVDNVQNLTT